MLSAEDDVTGDTRHANMRASQSGLKQTASLEHPREGYIKLCVGLDGVIFHNGCFVCVTSCVSQASDELERSATLFRPLSRYALKLCQYLDLPAMRIQ